jgi:hypothetical protein
VVGERGRLDALRDLVSARSFALGLLWGALAVVASPLPARLLRRPTADVGGLAFAFATYIGVRAASPAGDAPLAIALALILLALGGSAINRLELRLSPRIPRASFAAAVALGPGALALALAIPVRHPLWVPFAVVVTTPIVGGLLHDFDRAHGVTAAPFLLLLIASVGAYLSVANTQMTFVMCGVAAPLALLSFPQPLAALGSAGSAAIGGAWCWVVVVSGRGNPATVVGGLAVLGLLLGEPVARCLRRVLTNWAPGVRRAPQHPGSRVRAGRPDHWFLIVASAAVCQTGLMLYAARVSAVEHTAGMALASLAPVFVIMSLVATEIIPDVAARARSHSYRVPVIRRRVRT